MAVHEQPVDLTVRIEHLGRILRDIKAFDGKLATNVRREIRKAGDAAVKAAKAEVLKPAPSSLGNRGRVTQNFVLRRRRGQQVGLRIGLRQGIAAGIGVRVVTGKRTNGVRIVSSGSGLDRDHKPMVKAYNTDRFRHPVFGNRENWEPQSGRPYFGSVIASHRSQVQRGILRALDQAARTLARHY